jgi:hypothetical protein
MATSATSKSQPKRVILRLRVNQFEGRDTSEYDDAIKAYLTFAKRPTSELAANKHYAHIEPFQDPKIPQTSFHIVLDIEKDMLEGSNLQNLPHCCAQQTGVHEMVMEALLLSILPGMYRGAQLEALSEGRPIGRESRVTACHSKMYGTL